ncbi:MAG: ribokinase [Alphaproteobacteria bacterium]|nr:ribokinase [Alphaproteobacteria bacterium]
MIVVYGSMNADFFLNVPHFPKPGETILIDGSKTSPGGKGENQAVSACVVGGKVAMIGAVGNDETANIPLQALKDRGVDTSFVIKSNAPTGMAMVMLDASAENSIVVAGGANLTLKASDIPEKLLNKDNIFIFQMETEKSEIFKAIKLVKNSGAKVVLNVAPAFPVPEDVLNNVDYLIVNEGEAQTLLQEIDKNNSNLDASNSAKALHKITNNVVIITLGKNGSIYCENGKVEKIDPYKIKPVDTTGAGDCFVGIFTEQIHEGKSVKEACSIASIGSALSCLKKGAQAGVPTMNEILKAKNA